MRCLRFASLEGFKIEKSTLKYANLLSPNLKHMEIVIHETAVTRSGLIFEASNVRLLRFRVPQCKYDVEMEVGILVSRE